MVLTRKEFDTEYYKSDIEKAEERIEDYIDNHLRDSMSNSEGMRKNEIKRINKKGILILSEETIYGDETYFGRLVKNYIGRKFNKNEQDQIRKDILSKYTAAGWHISWKMDGFGNPNDAFNYNEAYRLRIKF